MKKIELCGEDQTSFAKALGYVKEWCSTHQWEVGAAEMALGAAAIAWSVQNGTVEMGRDLVASAFADDMLGAKVGSAVGAGIGTIGGAVLGSIGVTALGGAVGIPAVLLMGGGALLLGSLGVSGFLCVRRDETFPRCRLPKVPLDRRRAARWESRWSF